MKKIPGSFCCYSNLSPRLIQPSFDAQSLTAEFECQLGWSMLHVNCRHLIKFFFAMAHSLSICIFYVCFDHHISPFLGFIIIIILLLYSIKRFTLKYILKISQNQPSHRPTFFKTLIFQNIQKFEEDVIQIEGYYFFIRNNGRLQWGIFIRLLTNIPEYNIPWDTYCMMGGSPPGQEQLEGWSVFHHSYIKSYHNGVILHTLSSFSIHHFILLNWDELPFNFQSVLIPYSMSYRNVDLGMNCELTLHVFLVLLATYYYVFMLNSPQNQLFYYFCCCTFIFTKVPEVTLGSTSNVGNLFHKELLKSLFVHIYNYCSKIFCLYSMKSQVGDLCYSLNSQVGDGS
ncbi:hypothetical protein VP01_3504g1 [Puccinia sorghi]|uniref:Uncharacterized protein n=1 Tax=Puccinia sorghi TaxID=27349 RepID=A0A0L6UVM3_9BASI|nr:hypothetical protein VP01_3504g1 [Puccinia sorghi]